MERKQDWTTPRSLFDPLHREFGFTIDAAASAENALCPTYFDEETDGLSREWCGRVWCNPPYRDVGAWVAKAWSAARFQGSTVVMLVPARTDRDWWHDIALPHAEIRWLRGRVRFGGMKSNPPWASVVLIFRPAKA